MRTLGAFFRLVRFPNLLFIAYTQTLFQYYVIIPAYHHQAGAHLSLTEKVFWLLVLASVCIAAGGYVINDYFDLNIDRVNRPKRLVIEKTIPRRHAIIWHLILSLAGVLFSLWVSLITKNGSIVVLNTIAAILLWLYSTTFKRRLLAGNIVISALTAWVVLVLYFAESGLPWNMYSQAQAQYVSSIYLYAVVYAGFAFIVSAIREAVKDMEDRLGDQRHGRRTMAVAWGLRSTKVYTASWLTVLFLAVASFSIYFSIRGYWVLPLVMVATVIIPCFAILRQLWDAHTPETFARFSQWLKWAMLGGTSSMFFLP